MHVNIQIKKKYGREREKKKKELMYLARYTLHD